jgi:hypothetical protein
MRARTAATVSLILLLASAAVALQPTKKAPAMRGAASAAPPRETAAPAASQQAAPPVGLSARNANYSIDVELDPEAHTLKGRAVLTFRNISAATADDLRFHLYWNAWKNTRSTFMRERLLANPRAFDRVRAEDWGWIDVTAVRLLGVGAQPPIDLTARKRFVAPDDGNPDDQTVMAVPLPAPLRPGETLNVEISWTSRVPRTFDRTGVVGDYYFIAQWFPKLGVLENNGWNCHQFHANTEFYSDYGTYDVRLTVPRGWIVGATGREAARADGPNNTTTITYRQDDVHDFVWTTSPDYLVRTARFETAALPPVDMRLLLQPEHAGQAERHFEATRTALKYYGEWFGPYPYGHITIVDPAWQSEAGGMEYPTLFTAGTRWLAPDQTITPESVTVHEAGHQFWYGIVGNNEFEHAWLDEGLNSFSQARALVTRYPTRYYVRRYFKDFIPLRFRDLPFTRLDADRLEGYRLQAKSDVQANPSYRYDVVGGRTITYNKTALWLQTLENDIGWAALQKILSAFFTRWKFRHPRPEDFFAIANEQAGRDLTAFFDQVYRTSNVFDYGVQSLSTIPAAGKGLVDADGRKVPIAGSGGKERFLTTVVVRRYGEAIFPVDVLTLFENGEKIIQRWDGRDRWRAFTYDRPSRAASTIVDPERVLALDINYTNNSRMAKPVAEAASRKWAMKWMIWAQDLLLTFGFFV